ncbi:MAG: B12-binding domain-containing radical SAM protein [Spirochaetales bacterium]|nr:B12-binding domain-containing radical SAM protein [Spirochaetales bacterium]
MTILFVAPRRNNRSARRKRFGVGFFRVPPLGLLNVAAVTPKDVDVRLVDENVEEIPFADRPDLVGISVMTASADRAYEIADRFRELAVPVVLGGSHVSAMPEEALGHADSVVVGEAEGAWDALLADFRGGGRQALRPRYKAEAHPELAGLPFPDLEMARRAGHYVITNLYGITRGCPHNCSFCSVTKLLGRRIRFRPVEEVVREIARPLENLERPTLRDRFHVFVDDNIMANKGYAKELFRALIPHRILWISQVSVNSAYDDEMLELAAASGCKGVFIGLETVSEGSLSEIGKSQNRIDYYQEAVQKFHRKGIFVEGAFIFGFDHDGPEVFEQTVDFVNRIRLDGVQYTILTPLPGTDFYDKIEAEGRFIDRNWRNYDCTHTVFQPLRMSPEALQAGLHWAYKKTYGLRSILVRSASALTDARRPYFPLLLGFNLGYRKTMKHMFETALNPARIPAARLTELLAAKAAPALSRTETT